MRRAFWLLLAASLTSLSLADSREAAAAFQRALHSDPELIAFLKQMPKGADLHNHVSGAIYAENLISSAASSGAWFDPASNTFELASAAGRIKTSDLISSSSVADLNSPLNVFLRTISMRGWTENIDGHDLFFQTFTHIGAPAYSSEDALVEIINRAKAQNEQYMELMTGVAPSSATTDLTDKPPAVDDLAKAYEAIVPRLAPYAAAVTANLDRRDVILASRLGGVSPTKLAAPFGVRYIIQLNRLGDLPTFFAAAAGAMAAIKADPRVVALNMVAPEDHPMSLMNFDAQMRILDFLWKRMGQPNITLHAGELTLKYSPVEPMFSRIRKSIEVGHAKRIGHGVSIAWEDDLPGLFKEMRDKGILVEICLTSNRGILGVFGLAHPFSLYKQAGVPMNLNTDDEGVSRSNMTMEWLRAVREQGVGYEELKNLARNSLEFSFLPGQSVYTSRSFELRKDFESARSGNWQPSAVASDLMAKNPKLQAEVNLERAFTAFEARYSTAP